MPADLNWPFGARGGQNIVYHRLPACPPPVPARAAPRHESMNAPDQEKNNLKKNDRSLASRNPAFCFRQILLKRFAFFLQLNLVIEELPWNSPYFMTTGCNQKHK